MENVINNESEKAVKIGIKMQNADFIVNLLTTKLYQYKLQSAIREITTNAVDANKEAGTNHPVLIQVSEKDNGDYTISIRDFGVGLSPERFKEVFIYAGASTKRDDIKQQGMFGIGRFAVMAYTDKAAISSFYNGKKYKYIMQKNRISIEFIEKDITDTYLQNGMLYTWTVNKDDEKELIKSLIHISNLDNISIVAPQNIKQYIPKHITFENFDLQYFHNSDLFAEYDILISIDGITYLPPKYIDIGLLDDNKRLKFGSDKTLLIKFNSKELEVVPSREAIEDIPKNKLKIQNKVAKAKEELNNIIDSKLKTSTDNPEEVIIKETDVELEKDVTLRVKHNPLYKNNKIDISNFYLTYSQYSKSDRIVKNVLTYRYTHYNNRFESYISFKLGRREKKSSLIQFFDFFRVPINKNANIVFSTKDALTTYDKWYMRYFFNFDSISENHYIFRTLTEQEIKEDKSNLLKLGLDQKHVDYLEDFYYQKYKLSQIYDHTQVTKEERKELKAYFAPTTKSNNKYTKHNKKSEEISVREVVRKVTYSEFKLNNIEIVNPIEYWKKNKKHIIYAYDSDSVEELKSFKRIFQYKNEFLFIKVNKDDVKKVKDLKGYASLEEFKNGKFSKHVNRYYQAWYIKDKIEDAYLTYKGYKEIKPFIAWTMQEKYFFKEFSKVYDSSFNDKLVDYFTYLKPDRNTLALVDFLKNQKIDLAKYYYKSSSMYEILTVFKKDKIFRVNQKEYNKLREKYYERYNTNTEI